MSTTFISPPDERILLHDVTWETYGQLLANYEDRVSPRFNYDRGVLEIMSPSSEHEELNDTLKVLVNALAEEWGIEIRGFGSTTFRREDLGRGFEPDSSFYVQNVGEIRGVTRLDLADHPPPDLIIEIDVTHPSLDKLPIYAAAGVPEVWLYAGGTVQILWIGGSDYIEAEASAAFPRLTAEVLVRFIEEGRTMTRLEWLRRVRAWARA
jgi:Uma2 family endonuclease